MVHRAMEFHSAMKVCDFQKNWSKPNIIMLSERNQTQAHAQGFSPTRELRLLCIIIILCVLYIIITTICYYMLLYIWHKSKRRCLHLVSVAVTSTMPKGSCGGKDLFGLRILLTGHH